jgi:hypothetical protein
MNCADQAVPHYTYCNADQLYVIANSEVEDCLSKREIVALPLTSWASQLIKIMRYLYQRPQQYINGLLLCQANCIWGCYGRIA